MENRFGFLYKKISLSRAIISIWLCNSDFNNAVECCLDENKTIDNKWFYDTMREIYKTKFIAKTNGNEVDFSFSAARKGLRQLALVLYGDSELWCDGFRDIIPVKQPRVVQAPEGNEDVAYLIEVCSGLSRNTVKTLVYDDKIVQEFRKHGEVSNILEAFEVFKGVFYKAVRRGDKNSEDKRVVNRYWKWRRVVKDFSKVIFGDEDLWHDDYARFADEFLNE